MIRDIFATDTICAIATPLGIGGIGIVRISGSEAIDIVQKIFRPYKENYPLISHRLYYGWIRDTQTGRFIDEVLVSVMKKPKSYTREDVVEINCHSGYIVLEDILRMVLKEGARLAEAGEFTYRAFLHGRIDLTQAEAVNEIIQSRSTTSLEIARRQLEGVTSKAVLTWSEEIEEIQALLEAEIDFSEAIDEEEMPYLKHLKERLKSNLIDPIAKALASFDRTRMAREGISIALVGKPNVGKSSLLNALLEEDRAIVTAYPGTTRDIIEDSFIINGILIKVMDTAGIRQKADLIEMMGMERTKKAIGKAHIVLWLLDGSIPLSQEDDHIYTLLKDRNLFILINKADAPLAFDEKSVRERYGVRAPIMTISALKPYDIQRLRAFISEHYLKESLEEAKEGFVINQRHREHLEKALQNLYQASRLLDEKQPFFELISLELREAQREINNIVGRGVTDVEQILDRVFSNFCVGK